jgi:hypothetical protein
MAVGLSLQSLCIYPTTVVATALDVWLALRTASGTFRDVGRYWRTGLPATDGTMDGSLRGPVTALFSLDLLGALLLQALIVVLQPKTLDSVFGGNVQWAAWLLLGSVSPTVANRAFVGKHTVTWEVPARLPRRRTTSWCLWRCRPCSAACPHHSASDAMCPPASENAVPYRLPDLGRTGPGAGLLSCRPSHLQRILTVD